ncbi:hypothetical protein I4U23_006431 [Adineta vaga]|nr:hypothetical protein I4U23_006431 [Adineta vaga]
MTFLLHVEFDANSASTANKMLECLAAFDPSSGKSRKELCIRNDINQPLMPITASILDHYLHVTYIPVEHGFLHRNLADKGIQDLLIVCSGCDANVYELLNTIVHCVTCVTFEESNKNRQLIAVITQILNEKKSIPDTKPIINEIELVCSSEETIQKFKEMINQYFRVQSIHIQTSYSGYIHHKSS